jgi:hypothetical protein
MTGLEFIAEAFRLYGPVPLRLVTADRSEALRDACAARGLGMLMKPIDAQSLRAVMAELGSSIGLTTKAP